MNDKDKHLLAALWAVRHPKSTNEYSLGLDFGYALGKVSMYDLGESGRLIGLLLSANTYAHNERKALREAA